MIGLMNLSPELGVLYWHLNPSDYENDEELRKIRESRGYSYMVLLFILSRINSSINPVLLL